MNSHNPTSNATTDTPTLPETLAQDFTGFRFKDTGSSSMITLWSTMLFNF